MDFSEEAAEAILKLVENRLHQEGDARLRVKNLWWIMLIMHQRSLANIVRQYTGERVGGGPFKGMALTYEAIKQYSTPILLGCYEHELHPVVEDITKRGYETVLNIGCSVGYYTTGLAMRLPNTRIVAFDTDPAARQKCTEMLQKNNVQDRVQLGELFAGENFAAYDKSKTLVLMDIEGCETELLDPVRYPALQKMDILVELHDCIDPSISSTIRQRFAATHATQLIANKNILPDTTGILPPHEYIDSIHEALLAWEGRDGPTPWGYFTQKI
jgi:hypothetical protein